MSEEIKKESKEKECFCRSELFQRTLAVAIGSFVGVYCALNLFCALHRPPMMMHHHHHFMQQKMMPYGMMKPNDFQKFEKFKNQNPKAFPQKIEDNRE